MRKFFKNIQAYLLKIICSCWFVENFKFIYRIFVKSIIIRELTRILQFYASPQKRLVKLSKVHKNLFCKK